MIISAVFAMATMGVFAHPVEFGNGVTANTNAIAIGNDASVTQDESVAIGHNAKASVVTSTSSSVINGKTTNVKRDEVKDLKERVEMLENLLSK